MMMKLDGKPIAADCQTIFAPSARAGKDSLLKDFNEGFFFEISDIGLQLAAPSPDAGIGARSQSQAGGKGSNGVQLGEISITRQIDQASTVLMQSCINAKGFDSASIIKRRATGGGFESGQAYVRYDFNGVLIIKIDWSDEHIVKETVTFITRGLQVRHRQQAAGGDL